MAQTSISNAFGCAAALAAACLLSPASAQGYLQVVNFRPADFPPPLSVPIFDQDGKTLLRGSTYSAQLYTGKAGTAEGELLPVGSPLPIVQEDGFLPFRLNAPTVVQIPGVSAGQKAQAQLRVWDNAGGTVSSWESATVRGASEPFQTRALVANGFDFPQMPGLDGMKSFQLLPARPVTGAADGAFTTAFSNSRYSSPFYRPSQADQPWLTGDGRHLLIKFFPGTESADSPSHQMYLRKRGASRLESPTILPVPLARDNTFTHVAGVSSDASVVAVNDMDETPEAYLLWQGNRVSLPFREVAALAGGGRRVFGLTAAGDLVRHDWRTGETIVLRAGAGSVPQLFRVSHDGAVALLGQSSSGGFSLWKEGQGLVTTGWPANFSAYGLSGDGLTLVGQGGKFPAAVSMRGESPSLKIMGEAQGAEGVLWAASFDGSVMCGSASTSRGRLVVFTSDGRGYGLNELLPQAGVSLSNYHASQISDDGRTIFGLAESQAGYGSDNGWIADLVFPGDSPAVVAERSADGRPQFRFPTRAGFRYQVQRSLGLGAGANWQPWGDARLGDGTDHVVDSNDSETGFYRIEAGAATP